VGVFSSVLVAASESLCVVSHSCVCKAGKKILTVLIVLQFFSHKREGCNSRVLCVVKAQDSCLCTAPCYLFDSWGLGTETKLWQHGEKVSVLLLGVENSKLQGGAEFVHPCCFALALRKHKYTFTHSLKPASELEHAEGCACSPDSGFCIWIGWSSRHTDFLITCSICKMLVLSSRGESDSLVSTYRAEST